MPVGRISAALVDMAGAQALKLPWHMITSDSAANAKPVPSLS